MSVLEEPSPPEVPLEAIAPPSFEAFFRREYRAMVALAAVVAGSTGGAEDVAQEAMVRARRHWERISAYDAPGTWVRRVTINLARTSRRKQALDAAVHLAWFERRRPVDEEAAADVDPTLLAALRTLPRQQRAAVALHYLEDRATSEIAELLGCSEATARVHLHRGRRALADHLGARR